METISATAETLLILLGVIIVIGAAALVIWRWISSFRRMKSDIDNLSALLERGQTRISDAEDINRVLCRSILALLDHEITGNSIDHMVQARDDLQNHLVDR